MVLFVKGCIVDQYTIPSGSMEPTLRGDPRFFRGDRVLVNKWLFGPRVPFTSWRLWNWGAPERWDIVVFHAVDPEAEHPVLVKRVVGLPGERVRIKDGKLFINGEAVAPPEELRETLRYTTEFVLDKDTLLRQFLKLAKDNQPLDILNPEHGPVKKLYADMRRFHPAVAGRNVDDMTPEEVLDTCKGLSREAINTVRHLVLLYLPPLRYGVLETPEFSVVPEGHYFCLGDNSGQSSDGRVYGWVPQGHLLGRACAVWWPWAHRRDITGFTRTWWGMALIYGLPGLLAAFEGWSLVRRRRGRGRGRGRRETSRHT